MAGNCNGSLFFVRDPLSQGTTGLISWQGAVLLSAWADTFGESSLAGKRVLELGRFRFRSRGMDVL